MTPPLDGDTDRRLLDVAAGPDLFTAAGLGADVAFEVFRDVVAPACVSQDHPANLAFIPAAPTVEARVADVLLGASSLYGGSWSEGAGVVHVETVTLRFLAERAGLPATAGGVFVPGGTVGNLSALHAARVRAGGTLTVVCGSESHSSVAAAARVMGVPVVVVDSAGGPLTGVDVAGAVDRVVGPVAVVATAGTTNIGVVDDLAGIGAVCRDRGVWFHVDGAYGAAALLSDRLRPTLDGIGLADSFIVDPHKWLMAGFDACALLYRDPADGRAAHTQRASYIDVLGGDDNPTDLAVGFSRRPRGVPLWFSLVALGTDFYAAALDATVDLARFSADLVAERPGARLVRRPDLSIVAFAHERFGYDDWMRWARQLHAEQVAFVRPSHHLEVPVMRFAFTNPATSRDTVAALLDRL